MRRPLSQLQMLMLLCWCAAAPAGSGDYKTSWTIRNGGWPRYISTNIAGMWRQVFKVKEVKGLEVGAAAVCYQTRFQTTQHLLGGHWQAVLWLLLLLCYLMSWLDTGMLQRNKHAVPFHA